MLVKRVYPRWRGEHFSALADCGTPLGLSPLARGTHGWLISGFCFCRFIPAGAGNTSVTSGLFSEGSVYPRWRGEHADRWQSYRSLSRFIPAGAGNTDIPEPDPQLQSVYPRWRGEHSFRDMTNDRINGLSPLARGTRAAADQFTRWARFIPAGAGNTTTKLILLAGVSVYPR